MSRSGFSSPRSVVTPREASRLRKALLGHYDATRRRLPWRGQSDPYRTLVSEIMLQQTRVETVIPYYKRWLERFPTVRALAEASLDDVLLAWQGLGYYRRARLLHRAACLILEKSNGELPGAYRELRDLPGVGEYTAGAVASIAFGEAVPAVDGNVRRILARLFDEPEPTPAWSRSVAQALVDRIRPGDFNQALMDLGATVCSPRRPDCDACPLEGLCEAKARGTVEERPRRAPSRSVRRRSLACAVVVDSRCRALVRRRPEEGLLGGMWAFPDRAIEDGDDPVAVARRAATDAGIELASSVPRPLEALTHRFTHLEATYHPVVLRVEAGTSAEGRWIRLGAPSEVALPVAQQKIARAAEVMLTSIG
jgi:A/G-specific adenine glycosylase